MLNSTAIGNKIAIARKKVNLSQAELAQQVSISAQAVGKWERGESMPDILTLNRLSQILGVDLNYFSEKQNSENSMVQEESNHASPQNHAGENETAFPDLDSFKKSSWDMSKLNLVDSDFSGLKNLHEKFSGSNMKNCKFIGAHMAGLLLKNNHIQACDFTQADFSKSQLQHSYLHKNTFVNGNLQEASLYKSFMNECDFSQANFSKATIKSGGIAKSKVTNAKFDHTAFVDSYIQDMVFEGKISDCRFENCSFYNVKFEHAELTNTFFKNNQKFKKVQFNNCTADKITYAFLKNNMANLTGITIIDE